MEPSLNNPFINRLLGDYRLVLASGSERRKVLLKEAGLDFEVIVKEHIENCPDYIKGAGIAVVLSQQKAKPFAGSLDEKTILITADTIVLCDGSILGKPKSRESAISMLRMLSGKTHQVVTGVTLLSRNQQKSFFESTLVSFEEMSEELISFYVDTYKPFDKAGAYGIQEWIGSVACSKIEGSYLNVVGLPVQRVIKELASFISEETKLFETEINN